MQTVLRKTATKTKGKTVAKKTTKKPKGNIEAIFKAHSQLKAKGINLDYLR